MIWFCRRLLNSLYYTSKVSCAGIKFLLDLRAHILLLTFGRGRLKSRPKYHNFYGTSNS